jgi:hypothetical protein
MRDVDLTKTVETLGERLERQAKAMATRHRPALPWATLIRPELRRLAALTEGPTQRWRRVEPRTEMASGATEDSRPAPDLEPAPGIPDRGESGTALAPDVRDRLRPSVGRAVDAMRLHRGPLADTLAQRSHADAVTIERHVFVRHDRFRPHGPPGLALLANEGRHVRAALDPHAAWKRATGTGIAQEERAALDTERQVVRAPRLPEPIANGERPAPPSPVPGPDRRAIGPAPSPVARPMAADTEREVGGGPPAAPTSEALDMGALRQGVYHDLMHRIRTDFERGG